MHSEYHLYVQGVYSPNGREDMLSSVQEEQLHVQPENPLGDTNELQTEQQLQPLLSGQLLESTPPRQVLEPGQMSISHQLPPSNQLPPSHSLPPPHQLPMSEQLLFAEQQHQQMLEQQGGSFQLSPLAEPFVPNNSSFDPVVTFPLVSMVTYHQGTQGRLPHVHSQASPVHAQHSPLHTTIQNLPASNMQGSPVHHEPSMQLFGGEGFRGRQPNINQRPAHQVPDIPSSSPASPSLPVNSYNLQDNYCANLLSIIFHLLDKASCKPAGEGGLEVQKAMLLCQRLMLVESAAQQLQPQPQLQPTLPPPQTFTQQDQSQQGGGLPSPLYPAPHKRRESLSPPLAAVQMLPPAATCWAPNAPKSGRQKDQDGNARDGVQPKRADKLSAVTVPSADVHGDSVEEAPVGPQQPAVIDSVARIVPAAVVEKEGGVSTEEVPVRLLRFPNTGLVEEHSEDQKSARDVAGGCCNGDNVQVTMVPMSDVASSQIVAPTCSDDRKNDFQAVESGDHLDTKKGRIPAEVASSSYAGSLKEDLTNKSGSPQRNSISPIATPAPPLIQTESQRHLSDPPAGDGRRGQPKIGNSQLAQALLSPYPLFRPNSCAAKCLDFAGSMQPVHATASVPTQGVHSPPNDALLAGTAAIAPNGLPQRPHPPPLFPPPRPPGFNIPSQSPHREARSSPPAGAPAACAAEASIPPRLPVQLEIPVCTALSQTVGPPPDRFVKVKDLNSSVSEDGFLATPKAFVTQPPPSPQTCSLPAPPHAHEQNVHVALPPSSCSHHCSSQGGRRMPCEKTSHHGMPPFCYQGPPVSSQREYVSSVPNSPFLPPPPGLGWPLPPRPSPASRYKKGGIKGPPSPHPDLMSNYAAQHKVSPLISADQVHLHFQASDLHNQSLEYNRLLDGRRNRLPSYEQFGISGEQLMQYFCSMLTMKGRDLELNLLCGPYYRHLLKCYRVRVRENELLPPSFFDQYSCFTVYGEPGHFMVRLNRVTKEDHMTEQSHVTQLGSAPNTNDVPLSSSKGGEEPTVSEEKTLKVANGQQLAKNATKQSGNTVVKLESSTTSSQGLVNPDVLQVIHDIFDRMFELIGEHPDAEQSLSGVHNKSTVTTTDAETAEVPLPVRGDRPMTGSSDREQTCGMIERQLTTGEHEPKLSAGEKLDKESEETSTQPPAPAVSTDSAAQVSEAPAPIATNEAAARKENLDVDEKDEEASTEPLAFSADTMLGTASLAEGGVNEDIPYNNVPQVVTSGNKEIEIEKKQSGTSAVSSSEATELLTKTSAMEDDDAAVEPVSGGDKVEEGKLLLSSSSAATVATVCEWSSVVEDGDATTVEPDTGGDKGEEKESQISDIPTSMAADQVIPSAEYASEAWGSAADTVAKGEEVERKPISVKSSTLEDWGRPGAGKEAVERNDIPAVSLATEVSMPVESSSIEEDWGAATVELGTGEDVEQGGEGERRLRYVASTPEMAHSDESSSEKDQGDVIASTVTIQEKIEGKQSRDVVASGSKDASQLTDVQFTGEDWDAEAEQLPLPLAAEHTLTSREQAPAWSVIVYDEQCWVEGTQLQSTPEQVVSSTQQDPQGLKEQLTSAVVFDEDCWQESVVPDFVSIRSVKHKPLRILKREDQYKYDEEIRTRWSEHKPLSPSRSSEGAMKDGGGDRSKKTDKKWKKKKKKKGKQGQEGDDRHVRFCPASQGETKSTSGEAGEQISSSKDKEQLSSWKGKERWTREREGGWDRSSNPSQSSKEDSSKRGFDGEGGYGDGKRRETQEFYGIRKWYMRSMGRWYEYGAGKIGNRNQVTDRAGNELS